MNLNDPDFQKQLKRYQPMSPLESDRYYSRDWSPTSSRWLDPDMPPMPERPCGAIRMFIDSQGRDRYYDDLGEFDFKATSDDLFLKQLGIAPLGVE